MRTETHYKVEIFEPGTAAVPERWTETHWIQPDRTHCSYRDAVGSLEQARGIAADRKYRLVREQRYLEVMDI